MSKLGCGIALAVLLLGCTPGGTAEPEATPEPDAPASTATAPPSEQDSSEESPPPSASPSEPESSSPSASASESSSPTAFRPLDIEQRHPNGSVLRVTGVAVAPTSITLQVEVVNGLSGPIFLGYVSNSVLLEDDRGGTYEFIPPADNEDLQIEGRGTLTGEFVFYGVPDEGATSLLMQTNVNASVPARDIDVSSQMDNSPYPEFSVDIPLG